MSNRPAEDGPAPRSYLFVPGDRPERFEKAWDSAADAVIVDLEDAVPPHRKEAARLAASAWLRADRPVWVRCNAADTPWFDDDIAIASQPGVAGLVLPKAEVVCPALRQLASRTGLRLIALVETAAGIAQAESLAAAPEVERLAFGALDFQVDLGIEGDDDALLAFRSRLVLASRLAGKPPPIDGVTPAIDDDAALQRDTERARRLGFGGKLCIHPRQIAVVHAVLAPSKAERDWAARVDQAMHACAGAAVAVDGKMVDRPILMRARRIAAAPDAGQRLRG